MYKFFEILKKFSRRINKRIAGPALYLKYYKDNAVWEKSILFESYTGQSFQGNPYYIFKEMLNRNDCANMQFYISVIDADIWKRKLIERGLFGKNVHIVTYGSRAYVKALCHSKYLVNNVVFNYNFIKKEQQIYLNTWHGTGPKCAGNKLTASPRAFSNPQRDFLIADYILCPNEHSRRLFCDDHMLSGICEDKLISIGYPRNTVFFDLKQQENVINENNLNGKKIVFYLPTWRGSERLNYDVKAIKEIDKIAAELSQKYIFYCKLHPNMLRMNISMKNFRVIPEKYELYELLSCADFLITDWSSVYTDFANKSSNIILYQYDRDYMLSGRGLYEDFVENTPFYIAKTGDDVRDFLKEPKNSEDYNKFLKLYCEFDNINVTNEIINIFLSNFEGKNEQEISLVYIERRLSLEVINNIKLKLKNTVYKFVLPNNLHDDDYLFFNQIDDFEYLIVPVSTFEKSDPKTQIHRLWGNIKINKLFCENITSTPSFIVDSAHETVVIDL